MDKLKLKKILDECPSGMEAYHPAGYYMSTRVVLCDGKYHHTEYPCSDTEGNTWFSTERAWEACQHLDGISDKLHPTDFVYTVEVIRIGKNGKYYDTISFGTNSEHMWQIMEELEYAIVNRQVSSCYDYFLTGKLYNDELFQGEDLPNGYPVLVKSNEVLSLGL